MSSAWPLCMGLRSWKANTASAWSSLKRARSWAGVRRYSSSPSPQVTRPSTSSSPPASQSPPARICRMYGWLRLVVPNCRAHRSSYVGAEKAVGFYRPRCNFWKITFYKSRFVHFSGINVVSKYTLVLIKQCIWFGFSQVKVRVTLEPENFTNFILF
jgi:hypothetical protein